MTINLTKTQREALARWVEASRTAPGLLDSFGLGRSYIDIRAVGSAGYAERRRYVVLDHETAKIVPDLAGTHWRKIEEMLREGSEA